MLSSATAPPLSTVLGLVGLRRLLLQHASVVGGRRYVVLGEDQRPLFQFQEDPSLGRASGPWAAGGDAFGGSRSQVWNLVDPVGTYCGRVALQESPQQLIASLEDVSGGLVARMAIERSGIGKLAAQAAYPDDRPMLSAEGNVLSHNFRLRDASGVEVARVHEAWASVRDAFGLELVGPVDPVAAVVLTLLLDREKAEQASARPAGRRGREGERTAIRL